VAHFAILALLQMNDTLVFLKVIGFVTNVHALQAIIILALELETLLVLALKERFFSSSGQSRQHISALNRSEIIHI